MIQLKEQIVNPHDFDLPVVPKEFLQQLQQPTLVSIVGKDSTRSRAIVTLLHGNEPSGFRAIQQFLLLKKQPKVTLHCIIAAIPTALREPIFTWRQAPNKRDLNRCFSPPFDDWEGQLAEAILERLEHLQPEAVFDIHNTSGDGPAFSVCNEFTPQLKNLGFYFTPRMVVTDLRLGSLMETNSSQRPVITIECGGVNGTAADDLALDGLKRIANCDNLFEDFPQRDLDLYHHPVRLELADDTMIRYAPYRDPAFDITLLNDIDRLNFGLATPDTCLGWVEAAEKLRLTTASGSHDIDDYFRIDRGKLHPTQPLKLFMVTTNARIARSDCLLYAVKESDHKTS